jgi:hypothetical protein
MKDTLRQISVILTVVATIVVNALANILPLNGQNTGEISDRFKVYFVPAGYVFSIWGVIYIAWIAFAVYQALPAHTQEPRLRRLGYLFALSGVFNAAWLFCWHYNRFGLSVLVMLMLLGSLIASYLRLDIGRRPVTAAEKWCVDIPFSIYLGWITVATVANISDWLYSVHWDGFGIPAPLWAVIMLVVATALGFLMARTRRDAAYLFVLAWSFVGIAVKQAATPLVAITAWVVAAIALALALFGILQRRRVVV